MTYFVGINCDKIIMSLSLNFCQSGGMADTRDSKSRTINGVWVQLPPLAPNFKHEY